MKRSESDKLLDISIVDQFKKQTNQANINQKLERKIYSILRTDRKIEKQYRHLKSTRNHQSLHPIHQTPNYSSLPYISSIPEPERRRTTTRKRRV